MKQQKGATIIEIVIYTFLSITLLLVLTDIFSQLLSKSSESVSLSEVEIDSKFISQKIYGQLSAASAIANPANLNETSTTIVFTKDGFSYSYYLSGTNLFLNDSQTTERLNGYGNEITGLNFLRMGNPFGKHLIKVSFNIESTVDRPEGRESRNINLFVGTR